MDLPASPLEAHPPQRPTSQGHPTQEKRLPPSVKPFGVLPLTRYEKDESVSHYKEIYRTLIEGVCGTLHLTSYPHLSTCGKTKKSTLLYIPKHEIPVSISETASVSCP